MSTRLLGLVIALASTAAACATDPCGRAVPCPNEPQPTQAERDQCRMQFSSNDPCNDTATAYYNCQFDNAVCGSDGMIDSTQSASRAQMNCSTQFTNLFNCCTRNPNSTQCH